MQTPAAAMNWADDGHGASRLSWLVSFQNPFFLLETRIGERSGAVKKNGENPGRRGRFRVFRAKYLISLWRIYHGEQ
jgi:hypothetical protein